MISTQPVPKVEPGPFCSQAMMNVLRNFGKRGLSPFSPPKSSLAPFVLLFYWAHRTANSEGGVK